ncbi:hypothetical protein HELRODRAFT_171557 [Helobdella robusta]|uniref:EF-hand domain-containing protein n=1 Tax=Helobdella robusta TaxID=6412 RepID=T1F4E6_HELRO|nr:hypothetical protein HELRODRAFT_171557 [Helobdella robusta]ESO05210.1 hypothetical protein HELRODRAFT_171557 [Helobdella robusta]
MPTKVPSHHNTPELRRKNFVKNMLRSEQVSREELMQIMAEKAKAIFSLCDHERKEFITKRDMYRLENELPLSLEQLEKVFDSLDAQKQGYLTLQEFTNGFGSFVGLSPTSPSILNSPEFDFEADDPPSVVGDNNINQSDNFNNLLKNLSQCGMIDDHQNAHDEEIHSLYAQMETQLQEERDRIRAELVLNFGIFLKDKERENRLREKLELELQEKDKRLQELVLHQKEMEKKLKEVNRTKQKTEAENEKLILEKQVIEKKYSDSQQCLQPANEVQDKMISQKQVAIEIAEWIDLERQNLLKQIEDLKAKNKELRDLNDEIEVRMNVTSLMEDFE